MGKMVPIRNFLPNVNQCDLDAGKANAPLGYINRCIITRTWEVIKPLSPSLIKSQVVWCLDLDVIFRMILTNPNEPRAGQQERGQRGCGGGVNGNDTVLRNMKGTGAV